MIVTTGNDLVGRLISEDLGIVRGIVVRSPSISQGLLSGEEWVDANQSKYPNISFTCDTNEKGTATFGERASRKLYGVCGIPTQCVIDRDGKVVVVLVGYSKDDLRLKAGLARAGIQVDPTAAATGEEQFSKE